MEEGASRLCVMGVGEPICVADVVEPMVCVIEVGEGRGVCGRADEELCENKLIMVCVMGLGKSTRI